jgi:hypothetical protein
MNSMKRIFVVIAGLMITTLSQANPPRGAVPVFGQPQGQNYDPYSQGYDSPNTNYVETPQYDDQTDYYNDQPNYDGAPDMQYDPNQGSVSAEDEGLYQSILNATGGACDVKSNPHSFACTEWTFANNPVFPLFQMDWRQLQGEWFTVTYVNKVSENRGREFYMERNPSRPTQPMGVKNTQDNSLVGRMSIRGTTVTFENWRGRRVSSDPASFRVKDAYTVQFDLWTGENRKTLHSFDCRDFNRNGEHHLLCDWWVQGADKWLFKGYFGFIGLNVWESFLSQSGQ